MKETRRRERSVLNILESFAKHVTLILRKIIEVGEGFIHVHHIKPVSEIGETYQVDPIDDLIPVYQIVTL